MGTGGAPAAGPAPPAYGGWHRAIPDRACFAAIVYMARTSTPWRLLPAHELGCGSPATAWRRLDEWAEAGVFDQLHLDVLDRLGEQGRPDWSRASVDSASVRAKRGDHLGANPIDRGKPGSKLHLVCDGQGLPLAAAVAAAGVADVTMLQAMVDDIPPIRTPSGRRRTRPGRSMRIRAMTAPPTGPGCGGVGSPRGSLAVGGVAGAAGAAAVEGRAGAVVVELLSAAAGALGPRRGAVARLRAGGLCAHLRQPAGGQAGRITGGLRDRRLRWTPRATAAATAPPGSAAPSAPPPPAGPWSGCPGRPAGAAGR